MIWNTNHGSFWLGNRDSNPNKQSQSLSCYRYTIPQYQTPKQILSHLRVNIIHTLARSVNLFSKNFAYGLSFLFKPRAADAGSGYPGNYFMQILIFQPRCAIISWQCRCSSMAECQLPKLNTGVRFPSPAPSSGYKIDVSPKNLGVTEVFCCLMSKFQQLKFVDVKQRFSLCV